MPRIYKNIHYFLPIVFLIHSGTLLAQKESVKPEDMVQAVEASEQQPEGLSFGGVPALSYNSDTGFGFGAVGSIYKKDPNIQPYAWSVDAVAFATTRGTHSDHISLEGIELFNLPLRLRGKLGFYATINQNYCGHANHLNCQEAVTVADQKGLEGKDRDDFIFRYNHYRYMEFYGQAQGRWRLSNMPHKIELLGGWRGSYYRPGDFFEHGSYDTGHYAKEFSSSAAVGQEGFASVFEAGVVFDNRDNEPAPTSGYWVEATARAAAPVTGSAWTFAGGHLAARGYVPLESSHRVVLANQFITDVIFGDAPLQEIVRIGGILGGLGYKGFGGQDMGRGISTESYVGRVKIIDQLELRYTFWGFDLLSQRFDLGVVGFTDAGLIGWTADDFFKEAINPLVGFGSGLRISWNKTFVIRGDVAVSPNENYQLQYYVTVRNLF